MKKIMIAAALALGLLISGCAPTASVGTPKSIKKNIVGKWVAHGGSRTTRDGITLKATSHVTVYANGRLQDVDTLIFVGPKGKTLAKIKIYRHISWKIKGNTVTGRFLSCRTNVLKKTDDIKMGMVMDFFTSACKYTKYKKNREVTKDIRYSLVSLSPKKLRFNGTLYRRAK